MSAINLDECPGEVVAARLEQVEGVLLAIVNTYDDTEGEFMLPGKHMNNALWAVQELVEQARQASRSLSV